MGRRKNISVFDYTDYRRYLDDYYREQKKKRTAFSYRYFSARAGLNSTGLYKDVVSGRQSLGRGLIARFSKAMGHTPREAEYFENLVFFTEAKTTEERTAHYQRMLACSAPRSVRVKKEQFEYYSEWYYSAVRAVIAYGGFDGDYRRLGQALDPAITPARARRAVTLLEKLGFIEKTDNGTWQVPDAAVSTGTVGDDDRVKRTMLVTFQQQMLDLARTAYDRSPAASVDMSTVTLGLDAAALAAIKKELTRTRRAVSLLAGDSAAADRIYQLNMQLFPLNKTTEENSDDRNKE